MKKVNLNLVIYIISIICISNTCLTQGNVNPDMDKLTQDYKNHKISYDEYVNAIRQDFKNTLNQYDTKNHNNDQGANATTRSYENNNNFEDNAKIYSFDPQATNFERFKNSPCYDKIGFSPTRDMASLESQYSECENEYYTKMVLNIVYLLIFFIVVGVVVIFSISKERRNQLLKKIPKP